MNSSVLAVLRNITHNTARAMALSLGSGSLSISGSSLGVAIVTFRFPLLVPFIPLYALLKLSARNFPLVSSSCHLRFRLLKK